MKNDTMNRPRRERVNVDEVIGHLQEREAIECRRIEKGFTLRAEHVHSRERFLTESRPCSISMYFNRWM